MITPVSLGTSAAVKVVGEGLVEALEVANRDRAGHDGKTRGMDRNPVDSRILRNASPQSGPLKSPPTITAPSTRRTNSASHSRLLR